jgi:hypothetical protein
MLMGSLLDRHLLELGLNLDIHVAEWQLLLFLLILLE